MGVGSGIEHGQRPAPAGQFPGDGGVGHHGALLAGVETTPAGVQTSIGLLTPGPGRRAGGIPTPPQIHPGPIRLAVMPSRFDQQAAGMSVSGLGDRSLRILVIDPCERDVPEEYSVGTKPR